MDAMSLRSAGLSVAHEFCLLILMEHNDKIAEGWRAWKKRLSDPGKFAFQPRSAKNDVVPESHAERPETWRLRKELY